MIWAALVIFGALAVASDWLTMRWHRAREAERPLLTPILSMTLEALTWIPYLAAIAVGGGRRAWAIAAVSMVGSGLGTFWGMRRVQAAEPRE